MVKQGHLTIMLTFSNRGWYLVAYSHSSLCTSL